MTTAEHRETARTLETACEWAEAAQHWQLAIDTYPRSGPLARLDIENMAHRKEACLASAKEAA